MRKEREREGGREGGREGEGGRERIESKMAVYRSTYCQSAMVTGPAGYEYQSPTSSHHHNVFFQSSQGYYGQRVGSIGVWLSW